MCCRGRTWSVVKPVTELQTEGWRWWSHTAHGAISHQQHGGIIKTPPSCCLPCGSPWLQEVGFVVIFRNNITTLEVFPWKHLRLQQQTVVSSSDPGPACCSTPSTHVSDHLIIWSSDQYSSESSPPPAARLIPLMAPVIAHGANTVLHTWLLEVMSLTMSLMLDPVTAGGGKRMNGNGERNHFFFFSPWKVLSNPGELEDDESKLRPPAATSKSLFVPRRCSCCPGVYLCFCWLHIKCSELEAEDEVVWLWTKEHLSVFLWSVCVSISLLFSSSYFSVELRSWTQSRTSDPCLFSGTLNDVNHCFEHLPLLDTSVNWLIRKNCGQDKAVKDLGENISAGRMKAVRWALTCPQTQDRTTSL